MGCSRRWRSAGRWSPALLRLHEGHIADAIKDLLACHRLARLIGSGPLLLHGTVSRSIEIKACFADAALLQDDQLPAAEALAYRDELEKLAPQPSVADQFDHGERIMFLGFASELAQKQQPELEGMMVDLGEALSPLADSELIVDIYDMQMTVVWNKGMRSANKEWDRWLAAIRTPITAGRQLRLEALEAEARPILKQKPEDVSDSTLEEKGQWMGRMLATRMMPNLKPDVVVEDPRGCGSTWCCSAWPWPPITPTTAPIRRRSPRLCPAIAARYRATVSRPSLSSIDARTKATRSIARGTTVSTTAAAPPTRSLPATTS